MQALDYGALAEDVILAAYDCDTAGNSMEQSARVAAGALLGLQRALMCAPIAVRAGRPIDELMEVLISVVEAIQGRTGD